MNDFAPWQEWGELCDSAKCTDNHKAALYEFARINWHLYLDDESGGGEIPESSEVTGEQPWMKFESYCVVKHTTEGKSTKSWLFKRLSLPYGTPADKIRSGASLLMRSVVREFLRKEGRFRLRRFGRPEPSLDDILPNSSETLTYGDVLLQDIPDPGQEAELRDLKKIAQEEAVEIVSGFSERQRIVVTAWALGIALSNPEVGKIAGCKKSVLSDELNKTFRSIEKKIHSDYADEDVRGRSLLLGDVFLAVHEICSQPEKQPEMWQSRLFSLAADIEQ